MADFHSTLDRKVPAVGKPGDVFWTTDKKELWLVCFDGSVVSLSQVLKGRLPERFKQELPVGLRVIQGERGEPGAKGETGAKGEQGDVLICDQTAHGEALKALRKKHADLLAYISHRLELNKGQTKTQQISRIELEGVRQRLA